ncbi:accessory Sec system translocase SecA2 [Cryptosporangium phraense]|uniref:Protein translocase subunit SecA n=1 Tax=Cryptosporangium phraense TaxID=2593070 RepID=A0A545AGJ3_9ACTN|nr:accessory Sec system translocase SecA2 [Cryptosporangium phraense]TQS40439.1 accessory Sec system translocase SecA2 [Cryptosporangium phraense]
MGRESGWRSRLTGAVARLRNEPGTADLTRLQPVVERANARRDEIAELDDDELRAAAEALRTGTELDDLELVEFCAVAREIGRRVWNLDAYDVQLLAVVNMVRGSHVVDMATGEGKTLVGALVAAAYSCAGRRVHVLSVNDYLARRDAEWSAGFFSWFGISCSGVTSVNTDDERREAYRADVVYAPVHEVGFDLLRDRRRTSRSAMVLHHEGGDVRDVAVVDEIDAVLLDEALVPLVLAGDSGAVHDGRDLASLMRGFRLGRDYEVDDERRNATFTDVGLRAVERFLDVDNLFESDQVGHLTAANLALHAEVLVERDVDYLVRHDRVEIISSSRGRTVDKQRWPDGLQTAVEVKEGLAVSSAGEVLDQILIRALVTGYKTVTGMSGSAREAAGQIDEFYDLKIGVVPPAKPNIREDEPDRLYADAEYRDDALFAFLAEVHGTGQPLLIGTRSVATSEYWSDRLAKEGIEHVVLNARNDEEEAGIIAEAGRRGAVTVSTQMAGRGVDIVLGGSDASSSDEVRSLGGLCVVGIGRYDSARLDRQLRGRAGRQGDPGTSVFFTSVDDDLVLEQAPDVPQIRDLASDGQVETAAVRKHVEHAQRVAAGKLDQIHRKTVRYNEIVENQRAAALQWRDVILDATTPDDLGDWLSLEALERLDEIDSSVAMATASNVLLFHLDQAWAEHLADLAGLREGIHLRILGREAPLDEFNSLAVNAFRGLRDRVVEAADETLTTAELTDEGIDLEDAGLRRPTTTWTYMVADTPFATAEDGFFSALAKTIRG